MGDQNRIEPNHSSLGDEGQRSQAGAELPIGEQLEYIDEIGTSSQQQQQRFHDPIPSETPDYRPESEEIVQVVYRSNENGSLVGVESALITPAGSYDMANQYSNPPTTDGVIDGHETGAQNFSGSATTFSYQQQSRATSTLPSVAEESSSSAAHPTEENPQLLGQNDNQADATSPGSTSRNSGQYNTEGELLEAQPTEEQQKLREADYLYGGANSQGNQQYEQQQQQPKQFYNQGFDTINVAPNSNPIYSTVNKPTRSGSTKTFVPLTSTESEQNTVASGGPSVDSVFENQAQIGVQNDESASLYTSIYQQQQQQQGGSTDSDILQSTSFTSAPSKYPLIEPLREEDENVLALPAGQSVTSGQNVVDQRGDQKENIGDTETDISQLLQRQKQGAAESGSFRDHFKRKKLGISVSTNENDLITHRQKFLESQETPNEMETLEPPGDYSKFKRTHSVSFNVNSSRGNRHSVDIRNLPSYLTVKRASIVDVAKGAMSSLIHSFASGGGSMSSSNPRRDSFIDDEPIFEEPIAPTLSLGQRVALVKNSGAEFGTVGWIGQLPDVEDDWIVGVIFDNMIGNCDGAHNGVRYFYARENYAMFVPLSVLTKTDNYIGRPETGTMLSRMSVSLKPGQLISIQRSSIRLQHCFLNAPHQRVGHDVRAVSNRLHCQCHNCGPCAHLTKQSRINTMPHFGSHHIPHKKNSLAHAAVEVLAHHHHHYHEEEAHEEEDYQFGDNTAHACNFVRYSCCQQSGAEGHDFSTDCCLVRPELLDNLIHAPKAPHRRTRPRRRKMRPMPRLGAPGEPVAAIQDQAEKLAIDSNPEATNVEEDPSAQAGPLPTKGDGRTGVDIDEGNSSDSSSSSGSARSSRSIATTNDPQYQNQAQLNPQAYPSETISSSYQYESSTVYQQGGVDMYNTIDSQLSLMDQRRFVYQRDSSAFVRSIPSNISEDSYRGRGLVYTIRRCFGCMRSRRGHPRRPKKRKTSLKNRMIEYRRKQSTFVPSTLAKPHEDFASHGINLDQNVPDSNSDYSSYSRSSGSSRSSSPGRPHPGQQIQVEDHRYMTMNHTIPTSMEQLKSAHDLGSVPFGAKASEPVNFDDYTFSDGQDSCKILAESQNDSALTDLGFCDTCTNHSNDTLKSLVDKSINEEVAQPEPFLLGHSEDGVIVSPLSSHVAGEHDLNDIVEISSPTVSSVGHEEEVPNEDDLCQRMDCLRMNRDEEPKG